MIAANGDESLETLLRLEKSGCCIVDLIDDIIEDLLDFFSEPKLALDADVLFDGLLLLLLLFDLAASPIILASFTSMSKLSPDEEEESIDGNAFWCWLLF